MNYIWKSSKATIAGYPCVEAPVPWSAEPEVLIICRRGEVFLFDDDTFGGVALSAEAAAPLIGLLNIPEHQRHHDGTVPFSFPRRGDLLVQVIDLLGGALSGQEAADRANEAMDESPVCNA
jgi:hypothetical protein